jgi:hypothetical protein
MKKCLFMIYCMLLVQIITAQEMQIALTDKGKPASLMNVNGNTITTFHSAKNIEGTPLISEEWNAGNVKFKAGNFVNKILLKFNLEKNELYFQKDDLSFFFVDEVSE